MLARLGTDERQWLATLPQNAATEGGFPGFGGERLIEGQCKRLAEQESVLGVAQAGT